jgi:hypothetical protein
MGAMVYSTPDANQFFFSSYVDHSPSRQICRHQIQVSRGPFSLGGKGALRDALLLAGFEDIQERRMPAPLKMKSAADCVRF